MKKLSIQRRAQNQRGFTLTELLVGTVVLAIGVALMTILLFGALDDRRGETEGKLAAIAAMCGSKMGRSMGSGVATPERTTWAPGVDEMISSSPRR